MQQIRRFLRDDTATTAVEYAIVLAMIILVASAGIATFGSGTGNKWQSIDNNLSSHGF